MKRLMSIEELKQALSEMEKEASSDEMDAVINHVQDKMEHPCASTLKNYMEAVYEVVEEQSPDWVDYVDFALYLFDIANEDDDFFQVYETKTGYCVVYEDMEEEDDDEEHEEEECTEGCSCNGDCA